MATKFRNNTQTLKTFTPCGERFQDVYELDPDVEKPSEFFIRKAQKKYDIQSYINSFKDSCDINLIIERFRNGDIGAISSGKPVFYADITGVPDNIQELSSSVRYATNFFNSLPDSIKGNFADVNDFYNSVGTERFASAFIGNSNVGDSNEKASDKTAE